MGGGRRAVGGERWTESGGRRTVDGGRWTAGGGRLAVDGGRWAVSGGWWAVGCGWSTVGGERWTENGGRRAVGGERRVVDGERWAAGSVRWAVGGGRRMVNWSRAMWSLSSQLCSDTQSTQYTLVDYMVASTGVLLEIRMLHCGLGQEYRTLVLRHDVNLSLRQKAPYFSCYYSRVLDFLVPNDTGNKWYLCVFLVFLRSSSSFLLFSSSQI